jgi:hypothetical protein
MRTFYEDLGKGLGLGRFAKKSTEKVIKGAQNNSC